MKSLNQILSRNIILLLFITTSGMQLQAHPYGYGKPRRTYVYVKTYPVRPNVVVVHPAAPSPEHIWVDGDWYWNPKMNNYMWTEGRWVIPQSSAKWIPGHWKQSSQGYYWMPGHWKKY